MNTNSLQSDSRLKELFERCFGMSPPKIFSSDTINIIDTDIITGVDIIESTAWKILKIGEPPESLTMLQMDGFLKSLQSILGKHEISGTNQNEMESAISYVNVLIALYHELIARGVKTLPLASQEDVYERFVAGVKYFKSVIKNISEEELRSMIISVVFQVKANLIFNHQPLTAKIKISRWTKTPLSFAAHCNIEFKEKERCDSCFTSGNIESSNSISDTLKSKIAWITEHLDIAQDLARFDPLF